MFLVDDNNRYLLKKISNSDEVLIKMSIENVGKTKAFIDSLENPTFFFSLVGSYVYTCGILPSDREIDNINKFLFNNCKDKIVMPQNIYWEDWFIKNINIAHEIRTRYLLSKKDNNFNLAELKNKVESISKNYTIKQIKEDEYKKVIKEDWSFDFVGYYKDYTDFYNNGLGFVIYEGDEIISGCSSYGSCKNGIDISVATREDKRKKGLAEIVSAKLILECIKKDIKPHWDAANEKSLNLARKLGYIYIGELKSIYIKP